MLLGRLSLRASRAGTSADAAGVFAGPRPAGPRAIRALVAADGGCIQGACQRQRTLARSGHLRHLRSPAQRLAQRLLLRQPLRLGLLRLAAGCAASVSRRRHDDHVCCQGERHRLVHFTAAFVSTHIQKAQTPDLASNSCGQRQAWFQRGR
jgi:hypothetical protein